MQVEVVVVPKAEMIEMMSLCKVSSRNKGCLAAGKLLWITRLVIIDF
jgi:hypothetical protein